MSPRVNFRPFPQPELEGLALAPGEIHLWAVGLEVSAPTLTALERLLSDDQRQRAARFRYREHRERYSVSWGFVRLLLGLYLEQQPGDLEFVFGDKGKPRLAADPIEFNLSHCQDVAVVAVARGHAVGVDIERRRQLDRADDIATRYFSPREAELYRSLEAAQRPKAFLRCWTRKEAVVKAIGEGMFASLNRLEVSLTPGVPPQVLAIEGDASAGAAWTLVELEPRSGFLGALATQMPRPQILAWHLDLNSIAPGPEGPSSAASDPEVEAEQIEHG
jgi:4'-phosphopantetheinyl transferase